MAAGLARWRRKSTGGGCQVPPGYMTRRSVSPVRCACTPPGCQVNCTPGTPPTTPPQGTTPGGTTITVTTGTMPSSGLPTTGADLLLLGVAALGTIGVGAGAVALLRRRRNGEAS